MGMTDYVRVLEIRIEELEKDRHRLRDRVWEWQRVLGKRPHDEELSLMIAEMRTSVTP